MELTDDSLPSGTMDEKLTSSAISKVADFLATSMVKGARAITGVIHSGFLAVKAYIKPAETSTVLISQSTVKKVHYVEDATAQVVNVTQLVVKTLADGTVEIGTFLAPHIRKHGKKITSKLLKNNKASSSVIKGALSIATDSLKGALKVVTALDEASSILGQSIATETIDVVQYRYGDDAGHVAQSTFNSIRNIGNTAMTLSGRKKMTQIGNVALRFARAAGRANMFETYVKELEEAKRLASDQEFKENTIIDKNRDCELCASAARSLMSLINEVTSMFDLVVSSELSIVRSDTEVRANECAANITDQSRVMKECSMEKSTEKVTAKSGHVYFTGQDNNNNTTLKVPSKNMSQSQVLTDSNRSQYSMDNKSQPLLKKIILLNRSDLRTEMTSSESAKSVGHVASENNQLLQSDNQNYKHAKDISCNPVNAGTALPGYKSEHKVSGTGVHLETGSTNLRPLLLQTAEQTTGKTTMEVQDHPSNSDEVTTRPNTSLLIGIDEQANSLEVTQSLTVVHEPTASLLQETTGHMTRENTFTKLEGLSIKDEVTALVASVDDLGNSAKDYKVATNSKKDGDREKKSQFCNKFILSKLFGKRGKNCTPSAPNEELCNVESSSKTSHAFSHLTHRSNKAKLIGANYKPVNLHEKNGHKPTSISKKFPENKKANVKRKNENSKYVSAKSKKKFGDSEIGSTGTGSNKSKNKKGKIKAPKKVGNVTVPA